MERIKKKVGNPTVSQSTLNRMIILYDEYERNCERQPEKLNKWTTWFLKESFVIIQEHDQNIS